MRFYETETLERVGYDFYCDVANKIVEARKRKGWTQKVLSDKSGIKLSRLSKLEGVKIRIYLEDLEKLAEALEVTVNWLIDAESDCQVGECLYLVWYESVPDIKIYQKAASKRMAFLLWDKRLRNSGIGRPDSRERFFVKLVGVSVTDKELKDKFPKRTSDEEPIEP